MTAAAQDIKQASGWNPKRREQQRARRALRPRVRFFNAERDLRELLESRSRGQPNGCRVWTYLDGRPYTWYAEFSLNGRLVYAHRISYEVHRGPIPPGFHVLHSCDNPPCIEPTHLSVGLPVANAQDRESRGRGRQRCGENAGKARLTETQVLEIRAGFKCGGITKAQLARKFGVSQTAIRAILTGKTWKHLEAAV